MTSHLLSLPNPDPKGSETGRVYTRAEIARLFEHATGDLRLQLMLCYGSAMRLREALYLSWDRVDLSTGLVTLRAEDVKTGSKTGRGRSFLLPAATLEALRAHHASAKGPPFVFPSPTDPTRPVHQNITAWRRLKREAGIIGKARWHDLRHSRISHLLLEEGMRPVFVSRYAGVSIQTIDRVYLHASAADTKAIAEAFTMPAPKICKPFVNEGEDT